MLVLGMLALLLGFFALFGGFIAFCDRAIHPRNAAVSSGKGAHS